MSKLWHQFCPGMSEVLTIESVYVHNMLRTVKLCSKLSHYNSFTLHDALTITTELIKTLVCSIFQMMDWTVLHEMFKAWDIFSYPYPAEKFKGDEYLCKPHVVWSMLLSAEKHPHSMMLPPPCFMVGMVCSGWCAVSVFCHTLRFAFRPKTSVLVSSDRSTFLHVCGKLHGFVSTMALVFPLFHKARFVECMTNSCPVDRFSHLSCGSLQLPQSYHGRLGCFCDQCSPCPACQFRWTAMSWYVCNCAILFPFFLGDGLNSAPWDVQSLGYFFISHV